MGHEMRVNARNLESRIVGQNGRHGCHEDAHRQSGNSSVCTAAALRSAEAGDGSSVERSKSDIEKNIKGF